MPLCPNASQPPCPSASLPLSSEDWLLIKSKISTSLKGGKTKASKAYTEKGLYMLATILKSPRATQATIAIIEAFAKMRELGRNINLFSTIKTEGEKQTIMRKISELVADIFENDLSLSGTETTFEINFAVLKFKHTLKKSKK